MSLTLLTRGGSEPWKGAEPWGSPEAGGCFPRQVKEGSRLALSRPPLPTAMAGLGEPLSGRTEPTREKRAPVASRGRTHIRSCSLFMSGTSGLLITYVNEVSNGC